MFSLWLGMSGCFLDGVCRNGRNIGEESEEVEEDMENFFLGFWDGFGILKSCGVRR